MAFEDFDDFHNPERGEALDPATIASVKRLADLYGSFAAARMIGVNREAVARAAAGFALYASTRKKIRAYFAKGSGR